MSVRSFSSGGSDAAGSSPAQAADDLFDRLKAKRREIEASGLAQWEYAKPDEIAEDAKRCPNCGAAMELVKASDGAMIGTPYFPKYPIRGAELPRKVRPADFWSCSCDHCEER